MHGDQNCFHNWPQLSLVIRAAAKGITRTNVVRESSSQRAERASVPLPAVALVESSLKRTIHRPTTGSTKLFKAARRNGNPTRMTFVVVGRMPRTLSLGRYSESTYKNAGKPSTKSSASHAKPPQTERTIPLATRGWRIVSRAGATVHPCKVYNHRQNAADANAKTQTKTGAARKQSDSSVKYASDMCINVYPHS